MERPPTVDETPVPDQGGAGSPDDPLQPDDYHESSLWRWRGPASLIGGAMFAVLGWLLIAGILAYGGDDALANARPSDLVQILDSLETENDRLEQEARRLQAEIATLESGTSQQALAQAQQRLESLEILAGTTAVRGPGVRIVIRDPEGGIDATDILDAVQELRDAGAESIEVAQRRVVVDTWFANPGEEDGPGVLVSGELRSSPYTILAIGDPQTLATAMEIPGGVADSARTAGAEITIERRDTLDITSTVPLSTPEYAEPVQPE
jgi:uncharacterized protein YlxW (UPF0749 family)